MLKDFELLIGIPSEVFNAAINIYNKFCATGKGHNEFSNLIEVLDKHGVKYEYFTF